MASLTDDWSSVADASFAEAASRKRNGRRSAATTPRQLRPSRKLHAEVTTDEKLQKPPKGKRPSHTKLLSPEAVPDAPPRRPSQSKLLAPEATVDAVPPLPKRPSPSRAKLLTPCAAPDSTPSSGRRPSHQEKCEQSSPSTSPVDQLSSEVSAWAMDATLSGDRSPREKMTAGPHKQTRAPSAATQSPSGSVATPAEAAADKAQRDRRERRKQWRESAAHTRGPSPADAPRQEAGHGLAKAKCTSEEEQLDMPDIKIRPKAKARRKQGAKAVKKKKRSADGEECAGHSLQPDMTTVKEEDASGLLDAWLAPAAADDEAWVPVVLRAQDFELIAEADSSKPEYAAAEDESGREGQVVERDAEFTDMHFLAPKDPEAMVEERVKWVMEATGATTGEALQALESAGWNAEVAVNQVIDERAQVQAAQEASRAETRSSSTWRTGGSSKRRAQSSPLCERKSEGFGTETPVEMPMQSSIMEEFLVRSPRATVANPRASSTPRPSHSGGLLSKLSTAASHFVDTVSGQSSEWLEALKRGASNVSADVTNRLSRELGAALARDDSRKVNLLIDSALGGSLIGKNSPPVIRKAAIDAAKSQLKEALRDHDDPKRLKGALVAARRLNATELPEFHAVVKRYHELKKFPENWDVSKMLHGRRGSKMVAKQKVNDPAIVERFQRLLDSTFRRVYTRDRGGDDIPDRLKLVKVVEVANGELYVDYMARQEAIRREMMEPKGPGFWQVKVDTSLIADASFSWQGDDPDSEWSKMGDGPPQFALTDPPLDSDVNEVLLFHGTSHVASDIITTENFSVDFAGSYAGTLYGRGVYLAENASKSDEYARPDPETGNRTVLVCRVTLGRTFYTDQVAPDPRVCENACINGAFHSVIGDRRKCRGTFREFVVFDEEQIYANYILTYRRVRLTAKHGTE